MSKMLERAYSEMGVKEIPGPKNNERIMRYYDACGATWVKSETTPWCGAGLGYVARECGYPVYPELLRARAWLEWGQECLPQQGCVVVLRRGKNPREGHVGLLVRIDEAAGIVYVLGFNQNDGVNIAAFPLADVLPDGYRWPEGESRGQAMRDAVQHLPQFKTTNLLQRLWTTLGLSGGVGALSLSTADIAVVAILVGLLGYVAFELLKAGILNDFRKGNITGGFNA